MQTEVKPLEDTNNESYADMIWKSLEMITFSDGGTRAEIWKVLSRRFMNREPELDKHKFVATLEKMSAEPQNLL